MRYTLTKPSTSLRVFLMRHGEPVTYGFRNSKLNDKGVKQIATTAQIFENIFDDGKAHTFQIIYSSRKRTRESALDLYSQLIHIFNKNKKIKMLKPGSRKFLQTTDPINQIIKMGSSLDEAMKVWIRMPDDILKQNKIQTSDNMVDTTLNYLKSTENNNLSDIIAVTHETTLMAFQKKYFKEIKSIPEYTEVMEILINKKTSTLRIKYRNKEILQNDN